MVDRYSFCGFLTVYMKLLILCYICYKYVTLLLCVCYVCGYVDNFMLLWITMWINCE